MSSGVGKMTTVAPDGTTQKTTAPPVAVTAPTRIEPAVATTLPNPMTKQGTTTSQWWEPVPKMNDPVTAMTLQRQSPSTVGKTQWQNPSSSTVMLAPAVTVQRPAVMSDENVMIKEAEETHSPDAVQSDVRPLLQIVEDIFSFSNLTAGNQLLAAGKVEDKSKQSTVSSIADELSHTIERISCEVMCGKGGDGHATAISLLKMLSIYSWDAKLVLTLAAFALTYGEFWLLAQTYLTLPLAKSMAILKKVPVLLERSSGQGPKQQFEAIAKVIRSMVDVTRCIVEFYELPSMYIPADLPARSRAKAIIPTAAYRTIRGVLACTAQINSLYTTPHLDFGYSSMGWDPLYNVAQSIDSILSYLQKELEVLRRIIEEKWEDKTLETIVHIIYVMVHIDNMKVLSVLIPAKDPEPLYDCANKRPVPLEALRNKNVLLLISGLDISMEELSVLEQIYQDSKQHAYEVVWMPIVDPSAQSTEATLTKFRTLQSTMQWYALRLPAMIDRPVIRFVKDVWGYNSKPIMVVLDTQGKPLCINAIPMMLIWGSSAFPFTSAKERELWRGESWRLELLVDGIEPTVLEWIRDKKYIFLYGGEDIKWIRDFSTEARKVATATGIQLEMVYAGVNHGREKVRGVMSLIKKEQLSHCWTEAMIWFFWTRLESMLLSRIQIDKELTLTTTTTGPRLGYTPTTIAQAVPADWSSADMDPMVQEIKKLLSFGRGGGWALFAQGSQVLSLTHLTTVVQVLQRFKEWEKEVPSKGFPTAFWGPLKVQHDDMRPCSRLEFPSTVGIIPEGMKCPDCRRLMEKHITFLCCHEDPTAVSTLSQP